MAKIDRYDGNVQSFAVNNLSGEKYLFGSSTTDSDNLTAQLTSEYLRGWATVGASEFPPLEWFNAAMFTSTQFNSYLHQMGIAEWNSQQEYPTEGASCVHNGEVWFRGATWILGDEPGASDNWKTYGIKTVENSDVKMRIWSDGSVLVTGSASFVSAPDQSQMVVNAPLPFVADAYSSQVNSINPLTKAANVSNSGAAITVTYGTTVTSSNTITFSIWGTLS